MNTTPPVCLKRYLIRWKGLVTASVLLTVFLGALALIAFWVDPEDNEIVSMAWSLLVLPYGAFFFHRYKIAQDRLNYVAITPEQYPEIYQVANELCVQAELASTPPIYLVKDPSVDPCVGNPGMREMLLLGTDFLAGCRENNTPDAVRFMLAHQIGHIVAGHHRRIWVPLTAAAMGTIGFKTVLMRNMEFTADRYAAAVAGPGAVDALALCAVGKDNYPYVDPAVQTRHTRRHLGLMGMIAKATTNEVPPPDRLAHLRTAGVLAAPPTRVIPDHKALFSPEA